MPKERAYKEQSIEAQFLRFQSDERWRNMKDLSDGSYYISDKGRVMRLNPYGIFSEIGRHQFEGAWYVTIEYKNDKKTTNKRHNIARLVLNHFVGGDSPSGRRRFIYLDSNKINCRLSNLRWKNGFANGVDFWYLRKVKDSSLNKDDKIVKKFLLTDDIKALFELIFKKENLIKSIDFKSGCEYFEYNDFMDFVMIIRDRILEGGYKPVSSNYNKPNRFTNFVAAIFKNESYKFAKERKKILPLLHDNIDFENSIC